MHPGRGLRRGEIFWLRLTTTSAQCFRASERFFIYFFIIAALPYIGRLLYMLTGIVVPVFRRLVKFEDQLGLYRFVIRASNIVLGLSLGRLPKVDLII